MTQNLGPSFGGAVGFRAPDEIRAGSICLIRGAMVSPGQLENDDSRFHGLRVSAIAKLASGNGVTAILVKFDKTTIRDIMDREHVQSRSSLPAMAWQMCL